MSEAEACISTRELGLSWLAVVPTPLVMVNHQLRVLWTNPALDALIEDNALLGVVDGYLSAATLSAQGKLNDLVRKGEATSIALLEETEFGDHLLVRASQIPCDDEEKVYGLRILRTSDGVGLDHFQLATVFGLTPGETRVLAAMLDGLIADSIAVELAISVETVRSHIRRIYEKIGVSSREGLFGRVRQFGF